MGLIFQVPWWYDLSVLGDQVACPRSPRYAGWTCCRQLFRHGQGLERGRPARTWELNQPTHTMDIHGTAWNHGERPDLSTISDIIRMETYSSESIRTMNQLLTIILNHYEVYKPLFTMATSPTIGINNWHDKVMKIVPSPYEKTGSQLLVHPAMRFCSLSGQEKTCYSQLPS